MENNIQVPQKIEIKLPCDLAIPLLGIYPAKKHEASGDLEEKKELKNSRIL